MIDEVRLSITTGLPNLKQLAEREGPRAVLQLGKQTAEAFQLLEQLGGTR